MALNELESAGTIGTSGNRKANGGHGLQDSRYPLHASPMGQKLGYKPESLPEAYRCGQTLLRLPIHTGINRGNVEQIVDKLKKICGLGKGVGSYGV